MIPKRALILPVLGFALAASMAVPAQASVTPSALSSSSSTPLYFSAVLLGANEHAVPGGPATGDPDASAKAEVEVDGSTVTFALTWKNMPAPMMAHIHTGAAGVNGDEKVPLFTSPLPESTTGAAGVVTVNDPALVAAIVAHPQDFYLNLHTMQFPDGAVRGQLGTARRERDPLDLLRGLPLQGLLDGASEVPAGDPDGQGLGMIRASGHRVKYTFAWGGIGQPTMGHIHLGAIGVSGPVVVPLFMEPVPANIYGITGQVRDLDKSLVTAIRADPRSYYVNLHTTQFPNGAIRSQLYPAGHIGD